MINYLLISRSKHWPARFKKISIIIEKILKYKKDMKFSNNFYYDCNIILVNNKLITKINRDFRKKNYATDVLTFVSEIKMKNNKEKKICDIFFSAEIIEKDAKKNKISFYNHLTHLIVHSFLHINGFSHNKIVEFKKMKKIEIKILNKMKINNPYIIN